MKKENFTMSMLWAIASPATGEHINIAPFIFGGLALVLIVAIVVLTVTGKKKPQDGENTSSDDTSADGQ